MNEAQKIEAAEAASLATPSLAKPSLACQRRATPSSAQASIGNYHKKMSRVLDRMGGSYLLDDVLTAIHDGKMQSFVSNNSWLITQVLDHPRARELRIFAIVGDLADIDSLQDQIFVYANEVGAGLVSAFGRFGWTPHARKRGWRIKARNYVYVKDM
jgi:hypothetical protein